MAAALLQYQACLGIMVRLQVEDLTLLKQDFDRVGRGLSLSEFVRVMLDRVSWESENVVKFIEELVELFAQVDVNGDGAMEWEEFTSAIIEGGMGASSDDEAHWRDLQYEENPRFADLVNRPPKRVQLAPEFRRLLLYENTRPVVEIIDPSTLFLTESEGEGGNSSSSSGSAAARDLAADTDSLTTPRGAGENGSMFTPTLSIVNNFHPLCYIAGYRRDQDEVRSERSPVQALKYLSRVELLAVSAGDLKLTFWATTILTAASASALETPVPLAVVHTPRPQRVLEWDAGTQRLFSISADLMITVWLVEREKKHGAKGRCDVTLVTTLKKHTDLLQDLLVLNSETLVSCGMDSMIYLWDTQSLQLKAVRQGHRRGVRLLTKLSSQIFISAGFECEVFGWDISALATTPIFKLWGHTSPVCCIQLISSAALANLNERRMSAAQTSASAAAAAAAAMLGDQAITVDDDGWFKWWNLASVLSIENNDLEKSNSSCLQTFRVGSDKYPWKAHSLVVLNNGQSILAAGLHKLKLLHRVRLKPQVLASSVVLYNSVSFTLLTTTDKELRIWDASSGALIRTYSNLTTSDITCVDLDARQRKIVFGTQNGELFVLNYLNGAVLKQWTPHQLQVSALLYCKEDQCVLTASWDRSLRLYDDNASTNALLRCITDAHDTDIKCLAYCYALSLFVSGSTDGTIKIWDYIYFLLEDTCLTGGGDSASSAVSGAGHHHRRESSTGSSSDSSVTAVASHPMVACDVNALEFIEPYPLLLSGHENGMVCIWSLSPTQPTTLLLCFYPLLSVPPPLAAPSTVSSGNTGAGGGNGHEHNARGASVSCCRVFYDEEGGEVMKNDIRRGRFLLIAGSNHGEICVSDVSRVITKSFVKAFREESLPSHHHRSYNPRRRFLRQGKNAKRLRSKLSASASTHSSNADGTSGFKDGVLEDNASMRHLLNIDETDVLCVAKWRAHQGNIRCLNTVEEPRAILTCASDKSVCLWDFQGACLGNLAQNKNNSSSSGGGDGQRGSSEPGSTPAGNRQDVSWQWEVDLESATQAKREQAEAMWDQMKASKLKSAVTGHRQSVIEISRRQRKNSVVGGGEMRSSASAPILGASSAGLEPETVSVDNSSRNDDGVSFANDAEAGDDTRGERRDTVDDSTTKSEAERLFEQLQGRATWKQSDFQVARQVAWDRERIKFQQRMKKIMKSGKHSARSSAAIAHSDSSVAEYGQPLGRDGKKRQQPGGGIGDAAPHLDNQDGDDELLRHSASSDAALLAVFENPAQELPFGDKDNWSVGSLNRERQMYTHLHHENVRRSQKSSSASGSSTGVGIGIGGGSRLKKSSTLQSLEQVDLAPSAFLLEKLGSSCVVVENLPPPAKKRTTASASHQRKKSLPTSTRQTRSSPTLSASAAKAVGEQLRQERSEGGIDQHNAEDDAVPLAPHHSMQQLILQYDQLLQTQQAEQEQLHRTSTLLTRAVAVRKMPSAQHLHHQQYQASHMDDEDSAAQKPLKKVSSAPSNRRHPTNSHSAAAVERPISSAKAKRTTKEPGTVIPETAAAKKLRMRSDAALLRQDHFGPHSRDDVVNIYRTFQKIDRDQSGAITLRELVNGSGLFGGTHLQDNIMSIFSSIDKDQSGHIDLPELLTAIFGGGDAPPTVLQDIFRFCKLLEAAEKAKNAAKKRQLTPEQIKELYALFKLYDLDHDGSIDVEELFSALRYNEKFYDSSSRSSSTQVTREDVAKIIAHFDVDTNATLDIDEFVELFRDDS